MGLRSIEAHVQLEGSRILKIIIEVSFITNAVLIVNFSNSSVTKNKPVMLSKSDLSCCREYVTRQHYFQLLTRHLCHAALYVFENRPSL